MARRSIEMSPHCLPIACLIPLIDLSPILLPVLFSVHCLSYSLARFVSYSAACPVLCPLPVPFPFGIRLLFCCLSCLSTARPICDSSPILLPVLYSVHCLSSACLIPLIDSSPILLLVLLSVHCLPIACLIPMMRALEIKCWRRTIGMARFDCSLQHRDSGATLLATDKNVKLSRFKLFKIFWHENC